MTDWNDLRFLLAAAAAGSVAGAARALRVDQSTVSRRIAALEDALAVRLFDRRSDGLLPTPAGERVLEAARRVEVLVRELEASVAGEDQRVEGTLRLATSETLAVGFLARHLSSLKRRHPGLRLDVITGIGMVNLLKREADLAVRVSRPTQANLIARKLGEVTWALYGSHEYLASRPPPRLEDGFAGHDVLAYEDEMAHIPAARFLVEKCGAARVVFGGNSILTAATAAAGGLGIAALPAFVAALHPELVRIRDENVWNAELWLAVHPELARTGRVRAVITLVEEIVATHGGALRDEPGAVTAARPVEPPARRSRRR